MAVDDKIPVTTQAAVPGATFLIKTFLVKDINGNSVEVQGIIMCDENGAPVPVPMSQQVGLNILKALTSINNILQEYTGCGAMLGAADKE